MDKILVIGCSGLLGNKIMQLGNGRFEMTGTYNSHAFEGKNTVRLDACDRPAVFKLMDKVKPDCVIDTHSLTNLDYCETHPEDTWQQNVDSAKNVAEACKKFGSKYIFMSTDVVFDGKKLRYTEKDKPHPLCYYAKTKLIMEYVLATLDVNYIVARSSVLYGTGGSGKVSFLVWLINKLRNKEQVRIVTDQRNNPTLTDNLTEQMFRLYEKDETGIFHITGKETISRYDFSVGAAEYFGLDTSLITPITSAELNQIAPRPGSVSMETDKVERATGIKTLTVKEGLAIFKKQFVIE